MAEGQHSLVDSSILNTSLRICEVSLCRSSSFLTSPAPSRCIWACPTSGRNVTVSFPDYVKNVASSEIYPTWELSAIRANVLAIISFA